MARKSTDALLITDASTQVFHQLCQINSESPKSNDLTQRMLPYANVHKLVKLWILKDMMQSDATSSGVTSSDPSDNTLKEHLRNLPHEIQFEIIKYIPTRSGNMNRDEWWISFIKHRLISSSIRKHAEREIMTRWNREGLNLSRFLETNESTKYHVLANLLKYHQVYNEGNQPLLLTFIKHEQMEEEKKGRPNHGIPRSPSHPVPGTTTFYEDDDIFIKRLEEQSDSGMTLKGHEKQVVVDAIMQELDRKALKDFTFENCKNKPLEFYTENQKYQIYHDQYHDRENSVKFTDNYFIKQLIVPIFDQPDNNTIALIASLKALETLHIIYYGTNVHFLLQQFTYCHAKTLKLTIPSVCPFNVAINSLWTRFRNNDDEEEYKFKVNFKHFPNLITYHIEGIERDSFTMDLIEGDFPSMDLYMGNQHIASYESDILADHPLQIHLSEFYTVPDWYRLIHSGIYINPFYHGTSGGDSMMREFICCTQLSLSEKKQFIEDVMRHPGRGLMSCQVHRDFNEDEDEVKRVERKCLHQWSIYCLNKYNTYNLFDGFIDEEEPSRDQLVAQYLLYGWNPEYNLLETLVGVFSYKLSQPLMKMVEEKLQANNDAFSLKSIQNFISSLLRKMNRFAGVKLIELVRKYHVDGCDLFKPEDVRNGRGLLHLIFSMDLNMVVMEKILQCVTPDDLLYVMNTKLDKATVLTLGLYSEHLTNEFLLKLIEKQPMLAHLPKYDDPTTNPIDDVEPSTTTNPIDPSDDNSESTKEQTDNLDLNESLGKRTLLHYVVSDMRRWELIPILIDKYGCDLNVQDLSGRTPRDVAILLLDDLHLSLDYLPPCLQ